MIPEYKLYHGAVIASIVDKIEKPVSFCTLDKGRLLDYSIDGIVGMQIKFATQRLRPWHFTFSPDHLADLQKMEAAYVAAFLVLVCRTDGLIAMPIGDAVRFLSQEDSTVSWLRANRKKREMYRLYGPQGEYDSKFKTTVDPIVESLLTHRVIS